jgi:hypothetical protein
MLIYLLSTGYIKFSLLKKFTVAQEPLEDFLYIFFPLSAAAIQKKSGVKIRIESVQ